MRPRPKLMRSRTCCPYWASTVEGGRFLTPHGKVTPNVADPDSWNQYVFISDPANLQISIPRNANTSLNASSPMLCSQTVPAGDFEPAGCPGGDDDDDGGPDDLYSGTTTVDDTSLSWNTAAGGVSDVDSSSNVYTSYLVYSQWKRF